MCSKIASDLPLTQLLLAIAFLVVLATQLNGQHPNYQQSHYSINEGLPHKHINGILPHSDGFIYIGTRNGLCRFDGYEFLQIPLPKRPAYTEGSVGPWVGRLREQKDGNILIGYIKHASTLVFEDYVFEPQTGLEYVLDSTINIQDLLLPNVNKSELINDTLISYDQFQNSIILYRRNKAYHAILKTPNQQQDISSVYAQEHHWVLPIGKDYSKCFFYSSFNGLQKVSPSTSVFNNFLDNSKNTWDFGLKVRAIYPLASDNIIVSTQDSNLISFNPLTNLHRLLDFTDLITGKSLDTRWIQSIVKQNSHTIWAASHFDGVQRLDLNDMTGTIVFSDPFYRVYHMIQLNNGDMIASGKSLDGALLIARFHSSDPENIEILLDDSTSNLAITNSYLLPANNNKLWIGFNNGLHLFDLKTKEVETTFTFKNEMPTGVKDASIRPILSGKSVIALYETADNKLLIGMDIGGLNILNLDDYSIEIIDKNNGLPHETVAGIIPDSSGYWLSTYNGLCHLNKINGLTNNYYTNNGLPHNEFNRFSFAKGSDQTIYFGGMNGITSFNSSAILPIKKPARILLSEATYYDRDGETEIKEYLDLNNKTFSIPSANRACSFKFMIDDFAHSTSNTFSYLLQPKNNWFGESQSMWRSNETNRTIQFDHLPSGSYDLLVRGITASGTTTNTYKLSLNVHDFFYKTWWFVLLVGLTIIGLVYAYYQMRLAQLERIEKLRTKLSSDLHDDVGSLLSGVAYQMELLEYTVDEKRKPLVQQIASSSRKAMNQMRDVVWAIDARNNTCGDLIERIREFAIDLLEPLGIDFTFTVEDQIKRIVVPSEYRHDILLICKEFLTNSVKHAQARNVNLHVYAFHKQLVFQLKDDGIGLSEDSSNSTGQGLSNIRMRADRIKAELEFDHVEGFGISLHVPDHA